MLLFAMPASEHSSTLMTATSEYPILESLRAVAIDILKFVNCDCISETVKVECMDKNTSCLFEGPSVGCQLSLDGGNVAGAEFVAQGGTVWLIDAGLGVVSDRGSEVVFALC